jgi:hypothetical protein
MIRAASKPGCPEARNVETGLPQMFKENHISGFKESDL